MDEKKLSRTWKLNVVASILFMITGALNVVSFLLFSDDGIVLAFLWGATSCVWLMEAYRNRFRLAIAQGCAVDISRCLKVLFTGSLLLSILGVALVPVVFIWGQRGFDYLGVVLSPVIVGIPWLGYVKYRNEITALKPDEVCENIPVQCDPNH
ncbi:MAG: hypothetical protein FWG38_01550 [Defluviitaleaceae bacterium]|nr:hypothetical protein [Defluviitaleaceae bacterium]